MQAICNACGKTIEVGGTHLCNPPAREGDGFTWSDAMTIDATRPLYVSATVTPIGWECPRCRRIHAPYALGCLYCNAEIDGLQVHEVKDDAPATG